MHSLFDRDGYVKTAVKTGDEPYKKYAKQNMDEINYCLECKKKACKHGHCKDLLKKVRKNDV